MEGWEGGYKLSICTTILYLHLIWYVFPSQIPLPHTKEVLFPSLLLSTLLSIYKLHTKWCHSTASWLIVQIGTTQLYTKNSFFMHFVYNFGEKFNILKIFCEIDPWIEMMDMSWSVKTLLRSWPADLRSRLGLWLIRNSWRSPWYMCSKIMHWGSSWNYDLHGQNST